MSSLPPPPSPTPPGIEVPNAAPNIVAAAFTTWAIAVVFVALRLYTRLKIVRRVGPADYCVVFSLIFAAGLTGSLLKETQYGMGKHVGDINVPVEFPIMLEAWWFSLLCYTLSLALSKTSICLLYLTIFTLEWARRACYVLLSIVILSNIWATASVFTYTVPLQATWDATVPASYTTSQEVWWAITGFAIGTDLLIFLLPIPLVLPLKLPRRQKAVVVGIFAIGFFICFVSLARLVILVQEKGAPDPDFTWNGTLLTYWTILEINTPIVVACIMTLKPLAARFFPRLLSETGRRSGGDGEAGEGSEASSGPPLTIGSKPSRNPLVVREGEEWMEIPEGRDLEGGGEKGAARESERERV
ncbi:hypothetical protein B0H67DRAFT_214086 [Lasiosphaeris hirsuta]|uniref:Rhodopsin domain-containing protein n=1 Tax=Lasiosphaeris hirsuta TaxID=260670 RepID=A0AA40AER5_9PEZI|nr:hypothetical protein B0H67DRAFT_214086 [Lasiosphaeris hirsuta]